jgi:hypothetical protein
MIGEIMDIYEKGMAGEKYPKNSLGFGIMKILGSN